MPKPAPLPPDQARAAVRAFYAASYRKFPDEAVPMPGNMTPREASRRTALRPRLIEVLKVHIHGLDEINQKHGTRLSLDGLLDELGIPEPKARR